MESVTLSDAEVKALKEKLRTLTESTCKVTLALAELLTRVYHGVVKQNNQDTPVVQMWGFEDFDHFAEASEKDGGLDMHQTTARRLVLMYEELFQRRSFPEGTLPYSITKLKELYSVSKHVTDARTMMKWVGKSREMTCCEFAEAVDQEFGTGKKLRRFNFGLKPTHYTNFMKKLTLAREALGGETKGETLMMVLEEWTASQTDRVRRKSAS